MITRSPSGTAHVSPSRTGFSPAACSALSTAPACARAAMTIMPIPQLKVRSISRSATPPSRASQPKTGSTGMAERSSAQPETLRQDARNILGEAAAGDMRQRPYAVGGAQSREQRLHVEPRRVEQRFGQRAAGREGRGRVPCETRARDDPAHERETVGMHARGRQAEDDIAGRDRAAAAARRARPRRPRNPRDRSRPSHRGPAFRRFRRRSARSRLRTQPSAMPLTIAAPASGSSRPVAK